MLRRRVAYMVVLLAGAFCLSGCGTVRYRVTGPTDGRKAYTEVQWDVVEIKFNDLWAVGLK